MAKIVIKKAYDTIPPSAGLDPNLTHGALKELRLALRNNASHATWSALVLTNPFSWLGQRICWLIRRADAITQGFLRSFFDTDDEAPYVPLSRMALVAAIAMVFVFSINFMFGGTKLGAWGDFAGGVLNPILTFLMFMGVLFTIVLQQAELRETRKEIRNSAVALEKQSDSSQKQVFEAAFFQMLSLQNEIVSSLEMRVSSKTLGFKENKRISINGRLVFSSMHDAFTSAYASNTIGDDHELSAGLFSSIT